MKNERGVTLIVLIVTIIVLIILTFTITVNIDQYIKQRAKTNFEKDMLSLREEINQYYARVKDLPIINRYTNLSMLNGITNINDNDEYYVIDIRQLDIKLNYGIDYINVLEKQETEPITDLFDIYIINKQSHTIYYPKGIEFGGRINYRLPEVYSEMSEVEINSYNKPYIPNGFVYAGGDWNSGYTIRGVTQNKNDEFVWVPCVLDQSKVKEGDTVVTYQRVTSGKYNAFNLANIVDGDNSTTEIRESIGKYGGFYIAKYEAGINGETENYLLSTKTVADGSVKPLSQAGKGVWNYITREEAIIISKAMINQTNTGVKSTLISGECWDTTLQWMVNASRNRNNEPNKNYDINSTGKGWYSDTPENAEKKAYTTGYYAVNNIYDMAGNMAEWTTENCINNNVAVLGNRGGYFGETSSISASGRGYNGTSRYSAIGFRVVLYK